MKKYSLVIGLLVLLLAVFYYVFFINNNSTDASSEMYSDFAIADTSQIETFIISDTENNTITITRKANGKTWMIGETGYKAEPSSVDLITETFYRIKVKQDVPEISMQNVLTSLSVRHRKVEIFLKGEDTPIKTWYIGSATSDHMGTYMLLKIGDQKSDIPYITYKPDMYGTLEVRFYSNFQKWRYSGVFNYPPNSIKKVSIKFNQDIQNSYTIETGENNQVSLYDNAMMPVTAFDSSQVKHYLTHYKKIHYNSINNAYTQEQVDSILSLTPYYEIAVTDNEGNLNQVNVWKIKTQDASEETNNEIVWNPEYAWCQINGTNEIFKIQFFSWDVLFKPLDYYKK